MQVSYLALWLLAHSTLAAARGGVRGAITVQEATAPWQAIKPAAVPAPAPAAVPSIETVTIETYIQNLDYLDLTDDLEEFTDEEAEEDSESLNDPTASADDAPPKKTTSDNDQEQVAPVEPAAVDAPVAVDPDESTDENVDSVADNIDEGVEGGLEDFGDAVGLGLLAKKQKMAKRWRRLTGAATVQNTLRPAIEETVKGLVGAAGSAVFPAANSFTGPAPAPAANFGSVLPPPVNPQAVVSLLHLQEPAQGPAPAPVPAAGPQPRVHVAFAPGGTLATEFLQGPAKKVNMLNAATGTKVKISVFDTPNNGMDDAGLSKNLLKQALDTGLLKGALQKSIMKVLGFKPKLGSFKIKSDTVHAWDMLGCENHMSAMIKTFTLHYTKEQVPRALYNECTNFVTKISFSHDYVLDRRDGDRCKKATATFAKRWKLGKNDAPKDFEKMCHTFCEAKYGNDAPTCHITGGQELATQPM